MEYRHGEAVVEAVLEFVARYGRLPRIVNIAALWIVNHEFISIVCEDSESLCEEFVELVSDFALRRGLATVVTKDGRRYVLRFYDIRSSIM